VWVRDYLKNASTDKPVDEKAADELGRLHAKFGYNSEVKFREDMRDAPVTTLLAALVYLNDHA